MTADHLSWRHRWIEAADGWRLSVVDLCPETPRGICLVGHAMMVDRRTILRADRPSLCTTLAAAGLRVLALDLRGHGMSGPLAAEGGSWTYDDLVSDVGVFVAHARELEPSLPLSIVGNSLFGHNALAWLGTNPETTVDAVAGLGVNLWSRRWTADAGRWRRKMLVKLALERLVPALPLLSPRQLGLGYVHEPGSYWASMLRWLANEAWDADDGTDYAALLETIEQRFLHVVSDADRLLAHPDDAMLFSAPLAHREVWRLGSRCREAAVAGLVPGHVEMASSPRCEPLWRHLAKWLK